MSSQNQVLARAYSECRRVFWVTPAGPSLALKARLWGLGPGPGSITRTFCALSQKTSDQSPCESF